MTRLRFTGWSTLFLSLCIWMMPAQNTQAADAKLHQRLVDLKSKAGNDHRTTVDSTKVPWRAIGRLNSRLGGHCTATVIGSKLILTAAHCLWNKRTRNYLPPQSLHFVAGWNKGDYLFQSKVKAIHPATHYDAHKKNTLSVFTHDWAFVDLEEDPVSVTGLIPIAKAMALPFQSQTTNVGLYTQAGYSADKKHVLTAHISCPIWGIDKNLTIAIHGCNALPGDSGSPILLPQTDGTFRLIGIHVGYVSTKKGGGKGIAVPASTFVDFLHKPGKSPQTKKR